MDSLFLLAKKAAANAYAPYTGQEAGVALLLENGAVYSGSCVENVAYAHSFDALESALGAVLIKENWLSTGHLPKIKKICYCASRANIKKQNHEIAPPYFPLEMRLLKIFAATGLTIDYTDQNGTVFASDTPTSMLESWPAPPFDIHEYIEQAAAQADKNKPDGLFSESPLKELFEARQKAFAPISRYKVAAMVENEKGDLFYGVNCEPGGNKALHAEAIAIAAMVSAGGAQQKIKRVTVLTAGDPGLPCGACRQYIREFSTGRTEFIGMNIKGEQIAAPFTELLPHSFGPQSLQSGSDQA